MYKEYIKICKELDYITACNVVYGFLDNVYSSNTEFGNAIHLLHKLKQGIIITLDLILNLHIIKQPVFLEMLINQLFVNYFLFVILILIPTASVPI